MYYLIITLHLLCSPAKDSLPFPYFIKHPSHRFEWKDFELSLSQHYKDSVLLSFKKIYANTFGDKQQLDSKEFKAALHFVNLNGDNAPDVVYEGWSGGEATMVDFFLNEKGKFREVFTGAHKLIDLRYSSGKVSSFVIYDPGCCDPTAEFERDFSVDTAFHCKLVRQRAIIVGASVGEEGYAIPDGFFEEPVRFKTLNPKYALRYSPEITDKVPKVDFDESDKPRGNIMAEYPANAEGIAWAYKKDATGREWWLVEMEPAFYLDYNLYWDFDDQYTHYFGWMSSRFVERLH